MTTEGGDAAAAAAKQGPDPPRPGRRPGRGRGGRSGGRGRGRGRSSGGNDHDGGNNNDGGNGNSGRGGRKGRGGRGIDAKQDDGAASVESGSVAGRGGRGGGRNRNRAGRGRGRGENRSKDAPQEERSPRDDNISISGEKFSTGGRGSGGRGSGGRNRRAGRGRGEHNKDTSENERSKGKSQQQTSNDEVPREGSNGEKSDRSKANKKGGKQQKGKREPVDESQGEKDDQSNLKNPKGGKNRGKDSSGVEQKDGSSTDRVENRRGKRGKNDRPGKGKDKIDHSEGNDGETNQSNQKKAEKSEKGRKKSAPMPKPTIPPNQPQQTNDINYGRGENISIMHVAEKPSIAQAIANGLCKGESSFHKHVMPVHQFTNPPFPKAPHAKKVTHKVTSVAGHVFSVDFPPQFQSWDSVDPAELFTAPIIRKPCKGSVVKHLQDEAKGVDFIVLWMDCDREGENINFEVLDCCMHLMKGGGGVAHYDRVYRAYFSAINPSDIIKAYNALGKPDKNQALSVDARQELDLKVGVAFSRFQTRFFQGRYGDLDSAVLSYGPCQTPTLGFCAQRHIDIETFKPEPYWTLELGILKRGRRLRALWGSGRSFNKQKVEKLVEDTLENGGSVKVTNVVVKEKKQGRPIALNTVAMLKACSKALGIGPHAAMQAAERLYLSGYLSYPRTESSTYPKSFDIRGTLQQQTTDGRWGAYVQKLLAKGHNKARGGVDMGDHPPITPCRSAGPSELSGDMARIFDLVTRHFIASVSDDAVWKSTRVDFEIETLGDKGKFSVSGKEMVSPGFLEILLHKEYGDEKEPGGDDEEDEEEKAIPEFEKGEVIPLLKSSSSRGNSSDKVALAPGVSVWASLEIKQKMTTPPGYLTESELISLMEKNGIGTDASIATHIENIIKRNYVRLESGRRLVPNKLGLVLTQGYHQIDSGLVLPKVRSDIEGQCNRIAKGELEKDVVLAKAIDLFLGKFNFFVESIDRMDVLFGSSFSKLEDVGKPFTRCGLSKRYLQYIPGPPPRLYNKYTETVYPLPAGGNVMQWSGRTCTVEGCNFELCLYSVGSPPRAFPLCPRCFNSPEWSLDNDASQDQADKEDENKERQIKRMAGKSLCLECPLPDDHPLIDELYVSPDPDSDGIFILDPHFGPKWRLVSTRDATIVHLSKGIDKITILNETDAVMGCHLMKIHFKDGQSPYPTGDTKVTCCYPTDEVLQSTSRVFHGSERTAGAGRGRGRGGRGRGRGRGGRGRGRR